MKETQQKQKNKSWCDHTRSVCHRCVSMFFCVWIVKKLNNVKDTVSGSNETFSVCERNALYHEDIQFLFSVLFLYLISLIKYLLSSELKTHCPHVVFYLCASDASLSIFIFCKQRASSFTSAHFLPFFRLSSSKRQQTIKRISGMYKS